MIIINECYYKVNCKACYCKNESKKGTGERRKESMIVCLEVHHEMHKVCSLYVNKNEKC